MYFSGRYPLFEWNKSLDHHQGAELVESIADPFVIPAEHATELSQSAGRRTARPSKLLWWQSAVVKVVVRLCGVA